VLPHVQSVHPSWSGRHQPHLNWGGGQAAIDTQQQTLGGGGRQQYTHSNRYAPSVSSNKSKVTGVKQPRGAQPTNMREGVSYASCREHVKLAGECHQANLLVLQGRKIIAPAPPPPTHTVPTYEHHAGLQLSCQCEDGPNESVGISKPAAAHTEEQSTCVRGGGGAHKHGAS
jgi:hypothetical protein